MQKSDSLTILIIMDGVRADVLYNSIQAHQMPYLEKYIFTRAAVVENCFTCFPTNTVPGHLAILTGCYADKHQLPHMKFWNLSQKKYRDYSGVGIFNLLDEEYNSSIKMIYEFFTKSYAFTLSSFAKGSNYAYLNKARMIFFYLMQKILGYKIILLQSLKTFLGYLKQNTKGSFYVLWLPVSDEILHKKGPTSPEFLHHLQEVDQIFFKALFEGYKGWDGLVKAGLQDSTYFFITADHGGFPIQTESELIQDLKLLPLQIKNKQASPKTVNAYDALIAYTDGVANFYVKSPVSQRWNDRIEYKHLVNYPTPQGSINLIEQLLTIPTISHVFAKESTVGAESFIVQSQLGKGRIQRKIEDHKILLAYQVLSGADPFEYKNPQILALMDGTFYSTEEWLNKLVGTNYPMMLDQIPRVFNCANIGDLLIMGKERYSFSKKSKGGTHDTGTHICFRVPLIMAGPAIKHVTIPIARTVDIVPTILQLLKIDAESQQFDGRVLSEIIEGPL